MSECGPTILGDYHKYKYSSEITTQRMFSGAAFTIENPDQAKDQLAQYVAAAEGALKAYSAILQQDSKGLGRCFAATERRKTQGVRSGISIEDLSQLAVILSTC
jgi:hypothetical protein